MGGLGGHTGVLKGVWGGGTGRLGGVLGVLGGTWRSYRACGGPIGCLEVLYGV